MRQIRQTIRTEAKNEVLINLSNPVEPEQRGGERVTKCTCLMMLAVFALAILIGCGTKNLGIGKAQMLPESVKEKWLVDAPFDRVWQVASEESEMRSDRILVFSKQDGLISWCEEVENWQDLAQGTVTAKSLVGVRDPNVIQAKGMMSGRGTAVTTIWIEDLGLKSMLYIERAYFGRESLSGVGHSIGDYEKDLYRHIMEALE